MRGLTVERPRPRLESDGGLLESGPDQAVDELIDELVATDALRGRITRSRVATGPLLSRMSLSSARGRHLMLDIARTPAPRVPWLAPTDADDELPGRLGDARRGVREVRAVVGRQVGPSPIRAWYHRTPWAPAMFAEIATGTVAGPLPSPATCAALGAALAAVHTSGGRAGHRISPPLRRLLDHPDRITPEQRLLADRILAERDDVVPVHGQPALAHVLVPAASADDDPDATAVEIAPAAVLTGWSPRLGGSAALDLGHLLGDMAEIAVLAGLSDQLRGEWLRARLLDVRDGYCTAADTPKLDARFWNRVADGAVVRVLDHRCTLVGLLGPDAAPVALADRVAAHLTSPAFRAKGFQP